MRLSMDEVQAIKVRHQNETCTTASCVDNWSCDSDCAHGCDCNDTRNLCNTIEAQQQEIDNKDTAIERSKSAIESIIMQYTTDFTEFELAHDFLCPRERVILEIANETLELLVKALGGSYNE